MKWMTVGLLFLGLVAALCVALLVASLRADVGSADPGTDSLDPDVEILVAARAIPAMTIIDAQSVAKQTVPRDKAPANYLSGVFQVAGRVLQLKMVEGQPYTPSCFVSSGSGEHIAALLEDGMRAVSVPLTEFSGLGSILYPGSVVDVLVSLKLPSDSGSAREAMSTTLLRSIQVLAVNEWTVVSPNEGEDGEKATRVGRGRRRIITLMVNSKQAIILQLAREHGTVSLALRNPLDSTPVDPDGVLLSELSPAYIGRLARLANVAISPQGSVPAPAVEAHQSVAPVYRGPSIWEVDIFRGGSRETRTVPLPESVIDL